MKVGLNEVNAKLEALRRLLSEKNAAGILLRRQNNFSWLTGGRGFIGLASELACGQLLVTPRAAYLLANEIEAPRLRAEEVPKDLGFEVKSLPWFEDGRLGKLAEELAGPGTVLSDDQMAAELQALRTVLCPEEQARFRELGAEAASALEGVARGLRGGESEFEIAGKVSSALWAKGIEPITVLIAVDERTRQFRHLVPTEKRIKSYGILSICARKGGLVASATRLVHFGNPPAELKAKFEKNAVVEAAFLSLTRPGRTCGEIFAAVSRLYEDLGFPGEWKLHHQGGLTGYLAREVRVTPDSALKVALNQAYAWNPTITGVKGEDTLLVLAGGNEVVTRTGGWEYLTAEYGGAKFERPGILVL